MLRITDKQMQKKIFLTDKVTEAKWVLPTEVSSNDSLSISNRNQTICHEAAEETFFTNRTSMLLVSPVIFKLQ